MAFLDCAAWRDNGGPSDEAVLVREAGLGDERAFLELAGRYERRVFRLAAQITQCPAGAEEATEETFVEACERLEEGQRPPVFYPWLLRIAVRKCMAKVQQRPYADPAPESGSLDEARHLLVRTMRTLPPMVRAVLALRDIEEITIPEVAAILKLSVEGVKERLASGRLALREALLPFTCSGQR